MNAFAYLDEVVVAWRTAADWGSFARLLHATAWSHLNNGLHRWDRSPERVPVQTRIGAGRHHLTLRPFAGDVFVFYEVFGSACYRIPSALLDPGSVRSIVDLGANVGFTSLYLANQYPAARIVSVEPDPANVALLRANTRGEHRITPVHAAITGSPRRSVFLGQESASWGNRTSEHPSRPGDVEVPAVTMDALLSEHHIDTVDLLKVDIEGAEASLFAQPAFLDRVGLIVIELHGAYGIQQLAQDIGPMGFRVRPGDPAGPIMITAQRI